MQHWFVQRLNPTPSPHRRSRPELASLHQEGTSLRLFNANRQRVTPDLVPDPVPVLVPDSVPDLVPGLVPDLVSGLRSGTRSSISAGTRSGTRSGSRSGALTMVAGYVKWSL